MILLHLPPGSILGDLGAVFQESIPGDVGRVMVVDADLGVFDRTLLTDALDELAVDVVDEGESASPDVDAGVDRVTEDISNFRV